MFQRKPLRDDLHKEILARIGDGRLPAGQRINESRLSSSLGISRTPLREAMLGLEALGFLGSDMGRGFLVPALNVQEFIDIQFVLANLKPLALSLSFPLPPGRIMELHNQLGRARLRAQKPGPERPASLVEMIHPYSRLILGTCSNSIPTPITCTYTITGIMCRKNNYESQWIMTIRVSIFNRISSDIHIPVKHL